MKENFIHNRFWVLQKEKKFEFIYRERKPFQILKKNILLKSIHQNKQPLQNSQKLNGDVNILCENNIFTV